MPLSNYSKSQWREHRLLIERLYIEEDMTMRQVCDELRKIGFCVTIRMVKTRMEEWNLHKKLRLRELCTALRMLGPDRSQWPTQAPHFQIHRRVVGLDEIFRSFGRKGIRKPLEWIQTTADDEYEHSANVELLSNFTPDSTPMDSEGELDDVEQIVNHPSSTVPESSASASFDSVVSEDTEVLQPSRSHYPEVPNRVNWPLQDPEIYVHTGTAIQQIQSYYLTYMSVNQGVHQEPEFHRLTSHARFLDHMDEGTSLFVGGRKDLAVKKFRLGFKMLEDILVNHHPMAIATYLLLLCKLSLNKVTDVSTQLLKHAYELADTFETVPPSLFELLRAISKCGDFIEMPILCLRAASDVLESNDTMHWKTLYVKERHCDALYHAQIYGEGARRRAELLKLQEAKYGSFARNVLWTSLNVADDHLTNGQLDKAGARFAKVLQQSDQHSGYDRAKSRVPALEGLAKVAFSSASKQLTARPDSVAALQNLDSASQMLQHALELVNEALELAQSCFKDASRRIKRLLDLRDELQSTLDSLLL